MIVVPYTADHLARLNAQPQQMKIGRFLTPEHAIALQSHLSFTALEGDTVLACSGVVEIWKGRAIAWAVLSGDLKGKFLPIHRAVQRFLDCAPFDRIEADVDIDFKEGHRWLQKLGFVMENPRARKYRPDGGDSSIYARVK